MQNLWLKIKIWTKIAVFSILLIYLLIFIFKNNNKPVEVWLWFGQPEIHTSVLELIPILILAGVIGTLVVRMAFRAVRQFRELRKRNADAQMRRDVADIKTKAAMLQTRPEPTREPTKPA